MCDEPPGQAENRHRAPVRFRPVSSLARPSPNRRIRSAVTSDSSQTRVRLLLAGPAVRDRGAAVAAERLRPQLDPRRGLAALVLGAVDHPQRALDDLRVEAVLRELLTRAVELDVRLEHLVELRV